MIRVVQTGDVREDVRRIAHSLNFPEAVLPFTVIDTNVAATAGTTTDYGAVAVDRSVFRTLLPDARWIVYAAGLVTNGDTNPLVVSLVYVKNDGTVVTLGSTTVSTAAIGKRALGPFDLFGTAGVPPGEQIPMVRLRVAKAAGATATVGPWTVWLRLVSAKA